jgi:hypothetical protein
MVGFWCTGVLEQHTPKGVTRYEGSMLDGKMNGRGMLTLPEGNSISGEFKNGIVDGVVVYVSPEGMRFEGEWVNGLPDGQGTLTRPGLPPFSGIWKQGCFLTDERSTSFGVDPSFCAKAGLP